MVADASLFYDRSFEINAHQEWLILRADKHGMTVDEVLKKGVQVAPGVRIVKPHVTVLTRITIWGVDAWCDVYCTAQDPNGWLTLVTAARVEAKGGAEPSSTPTKRGPGRSKLAA